MTETLMEAPMTDINLSSAKLIKRSIELNESSMSANGAICVTTGSRTGRSPKDRFIVKDSLTETTIDWGAINQPFATEKFNTLWKQAEEYLSSKERFVAHLRVGADENHFLPVEVITEKAWHNLFAKNLFIRPTSHFAGNKEVWSILNVPGFKTNPKNHGTNTDGAVIINISAKKILICGILYAGEMKKAMFSVMNYILPDAEILPMHCAANIGNDQNVALFFGLSGTGKTTLSADTDRFLIGDDEHGWSKDGVFNFEGGCYAKCIDLSKEKEPLIWNAIRGGAIMENVILDPKTKLPNYSDTSLTQNTRAAYPLEHITQRATDNFGPQPNAVIFLCCDLYGVLPPVAQLNREQAAYYFLSGYTALVGSTEVGQSSEIKPTFSTCFGAPFFPRPAQVYANLLLKRLDSVDTNVYLVNTGWTGGRLNQGGSRFSIPTTRSIISAILNGEVQASKKTILKGFNLAIPTALAHIDNKLLNPRNTWTDKEAYDNNLKELIAKFIENFAKFEVSSEISEAGPSLSNLNSAS